MTARTILQSSGKPRRMLLSQPPHFRVGITAPLTAADPILRHVDKIMRDSDSERPQRSKSTGVRGGRV